MDIQSVGRALLVIGILIAVVGGVLMVFGRSPLLTQFGKLPGDIRVEGQGFTCAAPIVSMILLSIVLTIVLNIIVRLINRP